MALLDLPGLVATNPLSKTLLSALLLFLEIFATFNVNKYKLVLL